MIPPLFQCVLFYLELNTCIILEMLSIPLLKRTNKNLPEGQIRGLLHLLLSDRIDSFSTLLRITGLPQSTLKTFLASLKPFIKGASMPIEFLPEFCYQAQQLAVPYAWQLVSFDTGDLARKLREIRTRFPLDADRSLDQFFATEESVARKALLMHARGDLVGKRLVLLGDDDLVSIGVALLGLDVSVTVLDTDVRILERLDNISQAYGLSGIRTIKYDAREPLRPDLKARFDVAVVDPPYTLNGLKLFLIRCLELIGPSTENRVYLYYGISLKDPAKLLAIQTIFNDSGLLLFEKLASFTRYYGADSIGSSSDCYILQRTPWTDPPMIGEIVPRALYTMDTPEGSSLDLTSSHGVFFRFPLGLARLSRSRAMTLLSPLLKVLGLSPNSLLLKRLPGKSFAFTSLGKQLLCLGLLKNDALTLVCLYHGRSRNLADLGTKITRSLGVSPSVAKKF